MKELLKSDKLIKIAFISGLAAIVLIFLSSFNTTDQKGVGNYGETELESRISQMLLAMEGVTSEPTVTIKLDKDGLTVLGVTVVCDDCKSAPVKEKVITAVSKALDVSAARICGITMKRPRINLIIGKKHLMAAGLALVLAVGLYANFAISNSVQSKETAGNYGDTTFVSGNADEVKTDEAGDIITSTSTDNDIKAGASDEYFAQARIDRKNSREEAKQMLESIYNGGDMTKDELAVVAQDAVAMTDMMEAETKIETTLKAQGFEDVLCYLSENSANIIVKTNGLDSAQAAQIKSALLSEVDIAGENITIVEVNG